MFNLRIILSQILNLNITDTFIGSSQSVQAQVWVSGNLFGRFQVNIEPF